MTNLGSLFASAARQSPHDAIVSAIRERRSYLALHCSACGQDTRHTIATVTDSSGTWQRFTCPCGHHEDYR